MAKIDIKMPNDFLLRLSKLGEQTDKIISAVLEAGGEVVLPKVKSNLRTAIGHNTKYTSKSTGELADTLGVSPAGVDKDGNYNVKIGFSEPRSDGRVNAKIANILEYGKSGQSAKPFLKPAKTATKKACVETMKAKLEQEIDNL